MHLNQSHVLAESVILPARQKMVTLVGKAEQEISKIPLSNNTVQRRNY